MGLASSKPIPCGPCQEEKVNTKAEIWCYNCNEGLCSTCSGHHTRSQLSHDHKTIDIKSYNPSIHSIISECDKHGQQLNLYCPSHLMPCCGECISTNHSKCTGIKSLASVVEKTKIETFKESLDKDMYSTLDILNEMVNNKSENIKREKKQCESIKESIAKFRKKINKHLDHLEEELYHEIDTILDQEKSKASDLITEIEENKVNLNAMKDQLHAATTQSSKLESFLEVHQIEQEFNQCQRYAEDLKDDDRAKEFAIKLKQNGEMAKIQSKLESLKPLGEIFVDKTKSAVKRETSVRREAQVESREQSNINNMSTNIEKNIEINTEALISDMIYLMDGRIIVVDTTGKVNLLTPDGKLEKQLTIPSKAISVTQIKQNTIAITDKYGRAIQIFNLENEIVTKVITLDKRCRRLSSSYNSVAVCLDQNEIRIIDLEGNTLKSVPVKSESLLKFFVYCNDRVIYSDSVNRAIYCVDESGAQIWEYRQDLLFPSGLCTDLFGNIFVADLGSASITVISKDGQDSKQLIREEDGLHHPYCICLKHNDSSGFICDFFGNKLTKFNLCSG